MKQHDEWWEEYGKHYKIDFFEAITEDAFRAGMLASADVAERMYFTHTPDDGVISGEGVADELRKRANDGA